MKSYFFNKTFTVKRITKIDAYRTGISATLTAYDGSLQTMNDDRTQIYGGKIGQMYELYADVSCEMKEGDKAVIDSVTYGVQGVGEYAFGSLSHKRYVLIKEQS